VRETDVFERTEPIVITLEPRHLSVRLKGHREALSVDYGAILDLARKISYRRNLNAINNCGVPRKKGA
jgi:hypothetical protein